MKLTDEQEKLISQCRNGINFVRELNFSNEEISENFAKILFISENIKQCENNKNTECINNNCMHEVFYRDQFNQLRTKYITCSKLEKTDNIALYYKNYLIYQSDLTLKNKLFNKENIWLNNQLLNNRSELIKKLNSFLKSNKLENLYLYGWFGVGKTYIITLFCNSLVKSNKIICFCNILEIATKLKHLMFDNYYRYIELFNEWTENMKNCDLLVLDELGTEQFNYQFHIEFLMSIIRYRQQAKKPIFFISNFNLEKLKLKYLNNDTFGSKNQKDNKFLIEKLINEISAITKNNVIELNGDNLKGKDYEHGA